MKFPFYIAKRYLISKSSTNAINTITKIAAAGIVIGAMALFVVLSIFSGLREFSLSFANDFDPDYKVLPKQGKSFSVTEAQIEKIKQIKGVIHISKIVEERVLFTFNDKQQVAYLKGIDENFTKINKINSKLFNGQWLKPNTYQVIVGYGISQKLSMGIFDYNNPLEVLVPKPGKGNISINPDEAFTTDYLIPVGIYAINEELDNKYVFCDVRLAQDLLELPYNVVTGLEIATNTVANEQEVITNIKKILGKQLQVKTRAQLNATLHRMLNTENFMLYLIFTLVFVMILFAFVGSVLMIIIDKKHHLKTLFSLGSEIQQLRRIFLFYGIILCSIAGLIGLALGSIIVLCQKKYSLIMITDSLPYPVVFSITNAAIVMATVIVLGFIASFIASNRVSKKLLEEN